MATVAHSVESAAARATTAEKVASRSGEPLWKTLGMVLVVMVVLGLIIHKAFAPAKADETPVNIVPRKPVTAAELLAGLAPVTPEAVDRPAPPPPATPPPAAPAPTPEVIRVEVPVAPSKPLIAVSSIAVRDEPKLLMASGAPAPSLRTRHVPRGTIMTGFLESRILSDNLDSRVRVTLIEDFRLGRDVILPAGGMFIGDAMEVGSRYQNRLAVRVGNYIYPDGEREVAFSGLLLNPDESAHLVADDVKHHTGKLIAGTTALAALGAVTGVLGSSRGEGLGPIAGANAANGLGDLAQRNVEGLTEIMPTLVVDPGKPCWIFVDQSFDVPAFADLPSNFAPVPAPAGAAPGGSVDPRLDMMRAQMEQVSEMLAGLPKQGDDARR